MAKQNNSPIAFSSDLHIVTGSNKNKCDIHPNPNNTEYYTTNNAHEVNILGPNVKKQIIHGFIASNYNIKKSVNILELLI